MSRIQKPKLVELLLCDEELRNGKFSNTFTKKKNSRGGGR